MHRHKNNRSRSRGLGLLTSPLSSPLSSPSSSSVVSDSSRTTRSYKTIPTHTSRRHVSSLPSLHTCHSQPRHRQPRHRHHHHHYQSSPSSFFSTSVHTQDSAFATAQYQHAEKWNNKHCIVSTCHAPIQSSIRAATKFGMWSPSDHHIQTRLPAKGVQTKGYYDSGDISTRIMDNISNELHSSFLYHDPTSFKLSTPLKLPSIAYQIPDYLQEHTLLYSTCRSCDYMASIYDIVQYNNIKLHNKHANNPSNNTNTSTLQLFSIKKSFNEKRLQCKCPSCYNTSVFSEPVQLSSIVELYNPHDISLIGYLRASPLYSAIQHYFMPYKSISVSLPYSIIQENICTTNPPILSSTPDILQERSIFSKALFIPRTSFQSSVQRITNDVLSFLQTSLGLPSLHTPYDHSIYPPQIDALGNPLPMNSPQWHNYSHIPRITTLLSTPLKRTSFSPMSILRIQLIPANSSQHYDIYTIELYDESPTSKFFETIGHGMLSFMHAHRERRIRNTPEELQTDEMKQIAPTESKVDHALPTSSSTKHTLSDRFKPLSSKDFLAMMNSDDDDDYDGDQLDDDYDDFKGLDGIKVKGKTNKATKSDTCTTPSPSSPSTSSDDTKTSPSNTDNVSHLSPLDVQPCIIHSHTSLEHLSLGLLYSHLKKQNCIRYNDPEHRQLYEAYHLSLQENPEQYLQENKDKKQQQQKQTNWRSPPPSSTSSPVQIPEPQRYSREYLDLPYNLVPYHVMLTLASGVKPTQQMLDMAQTIYKQLSTYSRVLYIPQYYTADAPPSCSHYNVADHAGIPFCIDLYPSSTVTLREIKTNTKHAYPIDDALNIINQGQQWLSHFDQNIVLTSYNTIEKQHQRIQRQKHDEDLKRKKRMEM